jgi:hypothetical protein
METQSLRPSWMPEPGTLQALRAGIWWDAVVVPQLLGLDALEVMAHADTRAPGPVIWDYGLVHPVLYFLVPVGTAATWSVGGTETLGEAAFIGVPGATTIEPPGPHWLCPPDPDAPESLVDAERLAEALRAVQDGPS